MILIYKRLSTMNHISDDNYIFNNMFEKAKHYEIPLSRILKKLNFTVDIDEITSIALAEQFLINNVGLIDPIVKYNDDNILVLVGYKLRDSQRTPAPIASNSTKLENSKASIASIASRSANKIDSIKDVSSKTKKSDSSGVSEYEEYTTRKSNKRTSGVSKVSKLETLYETLLQEHEDEKIEKMKLKMEHEAEKTKLKTEHEAEKMKLKMEHSASLLAIDNSKKANIEIDECLDKIKGIYESLGLSSVKVMIVVDSFEAMDKSNSEGEHYKRIIHYPKDQNYSFKDNTPTRTPSFNTWFFGDHFTYQSNPPKNILHLDGGIYENPDLSKL